MDQTKTTHTRETKSHVRTDNYYTTQHTAVCSDNLYMTGLTDVNSTEGEQQILVSLVNFTE